MKKYSYNENIDAFEISEYFLLEGLKQAQKKDHRNIRIMRDNSVASSTVLDLSPLASSESVETLNISQDINLKKVDFSPLYTCSSLKALTISYLKDVLDFSKLTSLKTLYIMKAHDKIESLHISNVSDLLLAGIKNKDLTFLLAPKLETLRVSGGNLESLEGLKASKTLGDIEISHCAKLIDVSQLNELTELKKLSIEKCKHISDYSFLSGNNALETFFASELDSLNFIPNLKKIQFVKFWEVKDGDLQPLLNSKTLRRVDFFPQKKNYTHSKEEINNLIQR
ncbi:toxin [Pseudomonas folii]|uniref:Toxin n=1 Tax=Pseudomonas folii TaxID=2762593 RepID=A0ABR7AWF6_9PSED|nr:toxin [Pseudomonas folii]MBC3949262.1 toxin [Pseudomonas folii]